MSCDHGALVSCDQAALVSCDHAAVVQESRTLVISWIDCVTSAAREDSDDGPGEWRG